MGKPRSAKPSKDSQQLTYRGKQVTLKAAGDQATIDIDGRTYQATRRADMWRAPGVHNPYSSLEDLARHMIDYIHLI